MDIRHYIFNSYNWKNEIAVKYTKDWPPIFSPFKFPYFNSSRSLLLSDGPLSVILKGTLHFVLRSVKCISIFSNCYIASQVCKLVTCNKNYEKYRMGQKYFNLYQESIWGIDPLTKMAICKIEKRPMFGQFLKRKLFWVMTIFNDFEAPMAPQHFWNTCL